MGNVRYKIQDGIGFGTLEDGTVFQFDADKIDNIRNIKWYRNYNDSTGKSLYITDRYGKKVHMYLVDCPKGLEVDHINLDTLDNRSCNLRVVTHQQNQINQPLQRNNTSGVTGVSFYRPRNKFRARIKTGQQDIHLGYYETFVEAVQARNFGMKCMFGEFGRYNDVPPAPKWIKNKVVAICKRFAEMSVCKAFLFGDWECA